MKNSTPTGVNLRVACIVAVLASALVVPPGPWAGMPMNRVRERADRLIQIDEQTYRVRATRVSDTADTGTQVIETLFVDARNARGRTKPFDDPEVHPPLSMRSVRVLELVSEGARSWPRNAVGPIRNWSPLLTVTTSRQGEMITTTYETRTDTVSIAMPKALVGSSGLVGPASAALSIEIEVNGRVERLDARLLAEAHQLVSGEPGMSAQRYPQSLDRVFSRLEDRPRFLRALHAYHTAKYAVGVQDSSNSENDCTGVCLGCIGSLVGVGLGAAAIGASCGGVVFTGGLSLGLCGIAIVGGNATVLTSAASCSACDHCRSRPVPEDPGSPGSGGGDDPCDPCTGCLGPPPPSCWEEEDPSSSTGTSP